MQGLTARTLRNRNYFNAGISVFKPSSDYYATEVECNYFSPRLDNTVLTLASHFLLTQIKVDKALNGMSVCSRTSALHVPSVQNDRPLDRSHSSASSRGDAFLTRSPYMRELPRHTHSYCSSFLLADFFSVAGINT